MNKMMNTQKQCMNIQRIILSANDFTLFNMKNVKSDIVYNRPNHLFILVI